MPHESHSWKIGREPPLIRAHSLVKHKVLQAYLERYVEVLTANRSQEQLRLTLVDGFAGGGRYLDARSKEDRPGSPLIMLDAMRAAQIRAQELRSKPFHLDAQYIFIEKNGDSFEYLTKVLKDSEYGELLNERIQLLQGEFGEQVPSVIDFVKSRGPAERAIFVLDQCGYSKVPFPMIRTILGTLKNAEVILTFATDFLIDYLSSDDQTQQILQATGIELPSKAISSAKETREWRRTIQFVLHREILEKSGARFYTPFFIRSADSHRDFWLVHLSGHFRARDVMVGLHWQESTSFAHYGRSGLRMLGYDPAFDAEWNQQRMLPGFFFDDTARASSHEELMEQLPDQIYPYQDGIVFNDLFASLTNDAPVTAAIMKSVLNDLAKEGVIAVRKRDGSIRVKGIQHGTDILIPSRQKRLFLPKD